MIRDTENLLGEAMIYKKLDAHWAYNLLWVTEGDKQKLACCKWYGIFEPTVMAFGTTNTPADFEGYIKNTIWKSLNDFVYAELDAILIDSNSKQEHVAHVKLITQSILEPRLNLKQEKCEFHKQTVWYLGLIESTQAISMDEDRVSAVLIGGVKR